MVATFFLQRTTAFILFLIVPSLQISCFRKTKEKQYAKYDLNKRIAARLIWQLVIHSCVIFAYIISRRDGENNGFLAGVSLLPFLLARPSRFPRAQNPLSLPFQMPATQAINYSVEYFHGKYWPVSGVQMSGEWREWRAERKKNQRAGIEKENNMSIIAQWRPYFHSQRIQPTQLVDPQLIMYFFFILRLLNNFL